MLTPVNSSTFQLEDGREVHWKDMFTGYRLLSEQEILVSANRLLDVEQSTISVLAQQELIPRHARGGDASPAVVLHSTSPTLRAFEGDVADLLAGRNPHDVATYVEARSVYLAGTKDLAVGRTAPWREAVSLRGISAVDVIDTEYYYLSHSLLVMADEQQNGRVTPLRDLIDWLRQRPDAVVRLYALDLEMAIFLLWLRRQVGLAHIFVEANAPAVTAKWNRKNHIHPTVAQVRELHIDSIEAEDILRVEQQQSEGYRRLGMTMPVLPGYLISRKSVDLPGFVADVLHAAELLHGRYGINIAALKPSEAGDGARILGKLDITNQDVLVAAAHKAYPYGDDYLLEAWVDFLSVNVGGSTKPVVPSGHFRYGRVAEGITLQLLDQYSWRGNTYLDEAAWVSLGLPVSAYQTIRDGLEAVHEAFLGPQSITDGSYQGLVIGGVDFAVGQIGGRFDYRTIVGAIDFNLSSHGAEYLRTFMDEARTLGIGEQYGATEVFVPPRWATLRRLQISPPNTRHPAAWRVR